MLYKKRLCDVVVNNWDACVEDRDFSMGFPSEDYRPICVQERAHAIWWFVIIIPL